MSQVEPPRPVAESDIAEGRVTTHAGDDTAHAQCLLPGDARGKEEAAGKSAAPGKENEHNKAWTCLCGEHQTVEVGSRTWAGINKEGGTARITKHNEGA